MIKKFINWLVAEDYTDIEERKFYAITRFSALFGMLLFILLFILTIWKG